MLAIFKAFAAAGSLLTVVAQVSPADTNAKCVPTSDICRPTGIQKGNSSYFIQSTGSPNSVWQAEEVTPTNFIAVDLVAKTNGTVNQLWSVWPVNGFNSFSFVSRGPTSNVCANGDGGPLDSNACTSVFTNSTTAQSAQFFVTCQTCAADGTGAKGCQIQSANEGQCASFLDQQNNVIKLDDCSNTAPHQFWDIVLA
ncbi:hypothetical protein BDQ12DRAFT_685456 [Crucibulum laeve]|uniref:Ricin B lectin domain-containing protein n=1 Tax=Crucibulum laeve TaxID=68775 RepID=A0A5C3LXP2_9AGAR|nr:hypothetical protein BDQ12DRAFT_685456 [Crucibulum laeve]